MSFSLSPSERNIYRRYGGLALPRHTSYPVAPAWKPDFGVEPYIKHLQILKTEKRPFSLYIHVPFCRQLCFYCGCNKEIYPDERRQKNDPTALYIEAMLSEITRIAPYLQDNLIHQIHFGGGTPTFLKPEDIQTLMRSIRQHFAISPQAEIAMEIDPRVTTLDHLHTLKEFGFNRLSLGVQDFDERVQKATNRPQSFELVQTLLQQTRELGFPSINFDLIYGLPFQTMSSMQETIAKVIELSPDRIAFYRMALIPDLFRWQRGFKAEDMPREDMTLDFMLYAINTFCDAGYEFIGLDHFAKKGESLAASVSNKTLRRNFQGMTTLHGLDIIGLGPSAVSQLSHCYSQNIKERKAWQQQALQDFTVNKGIELTHEDKIVQELIESLYCYGTIDKLAWEKQWGLKFDEYFKKEIQRLPTLVDDGLLTMNSESLSLTPKLGRLLVRVVASVFDRYLPEDAFKLGSADGFSRVG